MLTILNFYVGLDRKFGLRLGFNMPREWVQKFSWRPGFSLLVATSLGSTNITTAVDDMNSALPIIRNIPLFP